VVLEDSGGSRGGGENSSGESLVSNVSMAANECGESHGGGMMFARRWRLRSRASHSGIEALCGGLSGFKGPWMLISHRARDIDMCGRRGGRAVGCSGAGALRAVRGLRDAGGV
jgi:hypothetical protein